MFKVKQIMKKRFFLNALILIAFAILLMGANTQDTRKNRKYVTIDTDAGAAGYWTDELSIKYDVPSGDKVYFSIANIGSMTITLQHKLVDAATWTDYASYTAVTRVIINDDSKNTIWRAGIKDADYTSGSATLGFNW
jgi:hypothetical protein